MNPKALSGKSTKRGALAWMARDKVTPNLLMLLLIIGGLFASWNIKKEILPPFDTDVVNITVSYSGSTPEEIDLGIILPIESAIQGIDGIYQIDSTASSGKAGVKVELLDGVDANQLLQEIDQEVSRITTLPDEADKPSVALQSRRRNVMELMFYGDVDEIVLRTIAENSRDRLLLDPGLTLVDLKQAPDHEVQVDVNPDQLRRYGLTISDVANKIKEQALDQSSGEINASGGDINVRVQERRDQINEFQNIPIKSLAGGSTLLLRDIAELTRTFEDSPKEFLYNGKPALAINVYSIGAQTPVGVSDAVNAILPEIEASLPPGVILAITEDDSEVYDDRLTLLLKNAFLGLILVLASLSLFLEYRLAFWVTMGIPTSFLGAMILLPSVGVSINMISMFAFIIALGIVVDDAIIAGENIYHRQQQGMDFVDAAIIGAKDVSVPLTFSILTNMIAFLPIMTLPGILGLFMKAVPLVVICVFAISWVESLFILPAHLGQMKEKPTNRFGLFMDKIQALVDTKLQRFIERIYRPTLEKALTFKYVTLAMAAAILLTTLSWQASGRLGFVLFPTIDADYVTVTAKLPYGSPEANLRSVMKTIETGAAIVVEENGGETLATGYESRFEGVNVYVTLYLTGPTVRPLNTEEVANAWRKANGTITGLETISYNTTGRGPGGGASISIELGHSDTATLKTASEYLSNQLTYFSGVSDISSSFSSGNPQLDVRISDEGLALGLTANDISRQLRNNLFGTTALTQQEGRNEVSVKVRLLEEYRQSEADLLSMMIRTSSGDYVPLTRVASIKRSISPSTVTRRDGRRTVDVTAQMTPRGDSPKVVASLQANVLPQMKIDFPGLDIQFGGNQQREAESMASLMKSCAIAFLFIYMLLAIPFQSFLQPLIVMIAIPFGCVGAFLGHIILGHGLSMISLLGIVALSGVVVNDSLMLINTYNIYLKRDIAWRDAIIRAATRRFRPIILTTITTFGGLAPMIFETSRQAQMMVPMAISLGFGILFATFITLVIIPCLCAVIEDIRKFFGSNTKLAKEAILTK
ncbi:hypothetical protein ACH42_02375 [Endozoicomonas sp. (ex Bugula neritina AB1)]|nr:hypothetical protein ACH42_02375 [Endozoicomonas sp. (ex Bugula neritina AB1)]